MKNQMKKVVAIGSTVALVSSNGAMVYAQNTNSQDVYKLNTEISCQSDIFEKLNSDTQETNKDAETDNTQETNKDAESENAQDINHDANQDSGICGESATWTYKDNTLTISGTGEMQDYEKDSVKPWDEYKKNITNVVIEDEITTIGKYSFEGCVLDKLVIGAGIKEISVDLFLDSSIKAYEVSEESIYTAVDGVIYADKGETIVLYPNGAVNSEFVIPEEVKIIGKQAFAYSEYLENVKFLNSVTLIEDSAFAHCYKLKTVNLPASVTAIGNEAFAECSALEEFSSMELSEIPCKAFLNCSSLLKVSLNNGITKVQSQAFTGCVSLESIEMPESVTYIDSAVCPKSIIITCKNEKLQSYGVNGYRLLQKVSISGERNYDNAYKVLEIINEQRKEAGLKPLYMDKSLLSIAMNRAVEQTVCFSHTRPDGSSYLDANELMISENVAHGQNSPENVMDAWMNSKKHKDNILNEEATSVGIGCFEHNGILYWVQCFGTDDIASDCVKPVNRNVLENVYLATETFKEASSITGNSNSESDEEYTYKFEINIDAKDTNNTNNTMNQGEKVQASIVLINPGDSNVKTTLDNNNVVWSSSNNKAVKVSDEGELTAVGTGETTITAEIGEYYKAVLNVSVKDVSVTALVTVCNGVDYKAVFDPQYYANNNPDIVNVLGEDGVIDGNTLINHFVNYGMSEGRCAKADFNVVKYAYCLLNDDLRAAFGGNMTKYYEHYMNYGQYEGRSTSDWDSIFDAEYYLEANPDVKEYLVDKYTSDGNLLGWCLWHYCEFGANEGRLANSRFSVLNYAAANPDVFEYYSVYSSVEDNSENNDNLDVEENIKSDVKSNIKKQIVSTDFKAIAVQYLQFGYQEGRAIDAKVNLNQLPTIRPDIVEKLGIGNLCGWVDWYINGGVEEF